jgi:hypothetical protein
MNIILVSIGNFQEYILDNINQLIKLEIKNIYVITNAEFCNHFESCKDKIILIDVNDINDTYNYFNNSRLDKKFRNGFWTYTSQRFFCVYGLMQKYDLKDCIHVENDVLLYYNIDLLMDKLNKNYLYIPFDTYKRNIASIIYIPNSQTFKTILDKYDFTKNDMYNFEKIKLSTGLIQNFPIFSSNFANTKEELYVSENFNLFNLIFDAAAMGQFLGGVDPRNIPGDSSGFVNETCVIKYDKYKFIWEYKDDVKKPFLVINDTKIPIFNLHIHSKQLNRFMDLHETITRPLSENQPTL